MTLFMKEFDATA